MSITDIIPRVDIEKVKAGVCADAVETSKILRFYRHRKKDGSVFEVELTAVDLPLGNSRTRLVQAIDVSERIRSEEEYSRLKLEAEKANRAKSDFLANMSHEIRTPLAAILGFVELSKDVSLSQNERSDYLTTVSRNGKNLSRLIDQILDLSKVESQKLTIECLPFNLGDVLQEVVNLLKMKAEEKGLALRIVSIPETLQIVSDPNRVRQVLTNLISNALKFTSHGSVSIELKMKPVDSANHNEHQFDFIIRDTGLGISASEKNNLFPSFSQADSSISRKFGGTGLGLALSKKLANALGGDVELKDSLPGEGSTFVFSMRCELLHSQEPASVVIKPKEISLHGVNVLVVDDAPDNRRLVSKYLESVGAQVSCEADGAAGVQSALSGNHDIVLMDIRMPKLDGFAALADLKKHKYSKPVLALTADAMITDKEACLRAGFAAHLEKPVTRNSLLVAILHFTETPVAVI